MFGVTFILFVISRFLPRKAIFLIALIFSLFVSRSYLLVIEVVSSGDDLQFIFMTITAFLGIWLGALVGVLRKNIGYSIVRSTMTLWTIFFTHKTTAPSTYPSTYPVHLRKKWLRS